MADKKNEFADRKKLMAKSKRKTFALQPSDLPPELAMRREPRLRGIEHNAVYRLIQYLGEEATIGGDLTNLPGLKWIFHPHEKENKFSDIYPLPVCDMRELYLTHVTAEDHVVGIWGSMAKEKYGRIQYLIIKLFIVASLINWVFVTIFGWGMVALFCVCLSALFIKERMVLRTTPYDDYKRLVGLMEFSLKSGKRQFLDFLIILLKLIAVILTIMMMSIVFHLALTRGDFQWPSTMQGFLTFIWQSIRYVPEIIYRYAQFGATDRSPLVMFIRLIFGILLYGLFYLWGRYDCNKLIRRGAFDFDRTVRMMETILQRWLKDHPFEDIKRQRAE